MAGPPGGVPVPPDAEPDLRSPAPSADLQSPQPSPDLQSPEPSADLLSPEPSADLLSPEPSADLQSAAANQDLQAGAAQDEMTPDYGDRHSVDQPWPSAPVSPTPHPPTGSGPPVDGESYGPA